MALDQIPLEKSIVAAIMKAFKARGVWAKKIHGGMYQVSGLPDIIAIAPRTGRMVGIEVKRPKLGRVTSLQEAMIDQMNAAGAIAGIARSVDEALTLIEKADGSDAHGNG